MNRISNSRARKCEDTKRSMGLPGGVGGEGGCSTVARETGQLDGT